MWRGDALIVVAVGLLWAGPAAASVFSEGGGAVAQNADTDTAYYSDAAEQDDELARQQYIQEFVAEEQRREQEKAIADQLLRQAQLEQILGEMGEGYEKMGKEMEDEKKVVERDTVDEATLKAIEEAVLAQQKREREEKAEKKDEKEKTVEKQPEAVLKVEQPVQKQAEIVPKQEEEVEESMETPSDPLLTMQKKGQSEFVSFIDPEASRLTKDVPNMQKRKLNEVRVQRLKGDGGLLYLAVGTVMLVGILGGAIGGALFYRRRRDEPDDQEYAPYAGTGPRSKKAIKGEQGDDTLAYKAQLHHYQQAKQKIICGEENAGVAGESEDEGDDVDDENNFSVYECPGLAPTGDIEVHNPNFAADPASRQ